MHCAQNHAHLPLVEDCGMQSKKRKICESNNSINSMDCANDRENVFRADDRGSHVHCQPAGRHFIFLHHMDGETIFHTEDWQPSGSTLFVPLTEDVMVNTRNVEQFSCSRGNFFVAGQDGVYSKTLSGEVLHLWRFCTQKRKLFISRSFLFKNSQDFIQVQQALQRL